MGQASRPRRGSMAYSPRKRAASPIARIHTWPVIDAAQQPRIQGFAGYKAGMTHAVVVDPRQHSTTAGTEIQVPVTVIEVPPMKIAGIRAYRRNAYGLQVVAESWAEKLDKDLTRSMTLPRKGAKDSESKNSEEDMKKADELRLIAYTQPSLVTGIPKKTPDIMEINIGGGTNEQKLEFAKGILGKDIKITDFAAEGKVIDVAAVTKGKGFQGHIKRWGLKLLSHKNSKHRRMIGTLGPHNPSYILPSVPQSGQMGFHQRTEFNKRIIKLGESGDEVTPKGGFIHYGLIRNPYVLIHGSVPGSIKRLVRLRDPTRQAKQKDQKTEIVYISRESKQGA